MNSHFLSFAETHAFSKLAVDHVSDAPALADFCQHPTNENGIAAAREARSAFSLANRKVLVDALKRQYQQVPKPRLATEQLNKLAEPGVYTITTAHQPNLLGGPAYLIYKIAGAIALAQRLNAQGTANHIPVYWMGAEDHDLDELNHTYVFGQKLLWETKQTGAVGRMLLHELPGVLEQLDAILGPSEHGRDLMSLIQDCYRPEYSLAQATRCLIDQLFGAHGLVVLDGDDAQLKALFTAVITQELQSSFSEPLVKATAEKLEAAGYKAQIYPREINLFWLADGMRERIIRTHEGFATVDGSMQWSHSELLRLATTQPGCFSPNVVLRPLYQELVLPNVAFIGGGAEVAYWMLLKPVFEAAQLPFPVVLLRASALVIDKGSLNRMEKLGISHAQLFQSTEQLIHRFIATHEAGVFTLTAALAQLEAQYEQLSEQVAAVDPSLKAAVLAEGKKALGALKGLESRAQKAQKQKHETELSQIRALKAKLFPEQHLQERHDNFMNFYLTHGSDFIAACVATLDPLEKRFVMLY
jgi:bacillithiol biosynthesis cysteine-adding enzyme BshC